MQPITRTQMQDAAAEAAEDGRGWDSRFWSALSYGATPQEAAAEINNR